MKKRKFFMTFSSSHPLGNYWIEVHATNEAKAREVVTDTFGVKWAFMYEEKDLPILEKYNKGGKIGDILEGE